MYGDVINVRRTRLGLLKSFKKRRKTEHHGILDMLVSRLFSYTHFGIEVEEGMVIHYIVPSIRQAKQREIVYDSIEMFEKDGITEVMNDTNYKFSRDEIVERAYSMLGTEFGRYSIFVNNCEHFAMWCATGEKLSNQSKFIVMIRTIRDKLLRTYYSEGNRFES